MALQYEWQSFQGTVTSDNRDYCGIAERSDATVPCEKFVRLYRAGESDGDEPEIIGPSGPNVQIW